MDDMRAVAETLAGAVERALPGWVRARGGGDDVVAHVLALVLPDLRAALSRDVDEPGPSPLAIVRRAVGPVTEALAAAGVERPRRDPEQERLFPDDPYDIVPASFGDLSPEAGDAGIAWGAARAYTHLERRRAQ
jgi:hypothetical protein